MGFALDLNPWVAMALELVTLMALMGAVRLYQVIGHLKPETARKLFHIGGGLTTLTFPWLFQSVWPVVSLTAVTIPTLLALKYVRGLKRGLGAVLYNIDRVSFGEVYFPLSVCLLFVVAHREPLLYCVPIVILTLADTVAALIGVRYGQMRYAAVEGHKSAEGSTAFFAVAFVSVLVPLLVFTDVGRVETLLIAAILGLLVMMAEAIAWRGLDNLFIPLTGYLLLRTLAGRSLAELATQFAVLCALSGFTFFWRGRTTLNGSALMGAILAAYVMWALGGWMWLLAPVFLFASYTTLLHRTNLDSKRLINLQAIFSIAVVGLAWLFLARLLNRPDLYYPYSMAFAAHLPMIGVVRHRYVVPHASAVWVLALGIAKGILVLLVAFVAADGLTRSFGVHVLAGLAGMSVASVAFFLLQPGLSAYPTGWRRWLREALCASAGSTVGLALMLVAANARLLV